MKLKHFLTAILTALSALAAAGAENWEIPCSEAGYQYHLQGIACSDQSIYWSFTDKLLKTGWDGKKQLEVNVPLHHGDLCLVNGKIYASVCLYDEKDIRAAAGATGWLYVYDAATLALEKRIPLPDTPRPDGITFRNGSFFVAGDSHGKDPHPDTTFDQYSPDFKRLRIVTVTPGDDIAYGIQTMTAAPEGFFLGLYAKNANTVLIDAAGKVLQAFPGFRTSVGMAPVPKSIAGERRLYLAAENRYRGEPRVFGALITVYEYSNGAFRKAAAPQTGR